MCLSRLSVAKNKKGMKMEINIKDLIVYEDNHLLVVIKPQNIACQGDESGDDNLLDMLKQYIKVRDNKPGNVFVGLVHRLDRPTGGLMVFAKTSKCASRISEQIRLGTFEKQYLAVVAGKPEKSFMHLENYLRKDEVRNIVTVTPMATQGAKLAVLNCECLQTVDGLSLMKVNLETGRGHQIRVQLAYQGLKIVGDAKYGVAKEGVDMALWAYKLNFEHPTTKEHLCFLLEPPAKEPWNEFDIERFVRV